MRERRGMRMVVVAVAIGLAMFAFLTYWMRGSEIFTLPASIFIGAGVLAVMGTQNDDAAGAADRAWREAAPDLPPVSDRSKTASLEATITAPRRPPKVRPAKPDGPAEGTQ